MSALSSASALCSASALGSAAGVGAAPRSGTSLTKNAARKPTTATAAPSRKAAWVPDDTATSYASLTGSGSFDRLAASSCADRSVIAEPPLAAISCCTRLVNSAPMIATPKELPSVRKRVAPEDATPMSFSSTLFCATSMVICIRKPMPAPSTAM